MAGITSFTDEEKAAFVKLAQEKGRAAASKKAKVSTTTISAWARAIGVKFSPGGKGQKRSKAASGKKSPSAASNGKPNGHANGKANGKAKTAPAGLPPVAGGNLEAVRVQLTSALATIDAIQASYRQVFG